MGCIAAGGLGSLGAFLDPRVPGHHGISLSGCRLSVPHATHKYVYTHSGNARTYTQIDSLLIKKPSKMALARSQALELWSSITREPSISGCLGNCENRTANCTLQSCHWQLCTDCSRQPANAIQFNVYSQIN